MLVLRMKSVWWYSRWLRWNPGVYVPRPYTQCMYVKSMIDIKCFTNFARPCKMSTPYSLREYQFRINFCEWLFTQYYQNANNYIAYSTNQNGFNYCIIIKSILVDVIFRYFQNLLLLNVISFRIVLVFLITTSGVTTANRYFHIKIY